MKEVIKALESKGYFPQMEGGRVVLVDWMFTHTEINKIAEIIEAVRPLSAIGVGGMINGNKAKLYIQ